MYASAEIQGQEVIGRPGQNLTQHELFVLVGIAEGIPSQVIAERMDAEPIALRRSRPPFRPSWARRTRRT